MDKTAPRPDTSHESSRDVTAVQLDPLLSIPLRNKFDADLENLRAECTSEQPVSVLWIDVDKFKQVNDVHGHPAGDEVLTKAVSALKPILTGRGAIYRYGGDEFIILLPNHTIEEACVTAERIREKICHIDFVQSPDKVTVSIGAASCPVNVATLDDLLKAADNAMYEAKDQGGNAVCASSLGNKVPQPSDRVIRADIASRVEAVELWMSLNQSNGKSFIILIENDSDEEVKVEGMVLRVGTLYLSRLAKPGKGDDWVVAAHSRIQVSGEFPSSPTIALGWKNMDLSSRAMIELDVVAIVRILGRLRRLSHTILAAVNGGALSQFGPS